MRHLPFTVTRQGRGEVKKRRFSEEQIIDTLEESEEPKSEELCRRYGMSRASLYHCRAKYGGMEVSEARRLQALEEEIWRLRQVQRDISLRSVRSRTLTRVRTYGEGSTHRQFPKAIGPLTVELVHQLKSDKARISESRLTKKRSGISEEEQEKRTFVLPVLQACNNPAANLAKREAGRIFCRCRPNL